MSKTCLRWSTFELSNWPYLKKKCSTAPSYVTSYIDYIHDYLPIATLPADIDCPTIRAVVILVLSFVPIAEIPHNMKPLDSLESVQNYSLSCPGHSGAY